MNLFKALIAVALTIAINTAVQAKQLTIATDVSGSNPLLRDSDFNQVAGNYAAALIAKLKRGDVVVLKQFGEINKPQNFIDKTVVIKRHNATKVANQVMRYTTGLPNKVEAQGATNLIAFLGRNDFGCADGGKLLVMTDGIEASEYANPNKLLEGKASLPAPHRLAIQNLTGCEVEFFGLGVGRYDQEALRLYDAWAAYFEQAGASFKAVIK